jgi:hypothetical protein
VNRRIGQCLAELGRDQPARNLGVARLFRVLDDNAAKRQRASRARRKALRIFEQQFRDAAADRSTPEQGNAIFVVRHWSLVLRHWSVVDEG